MMQLSHKTRKLNGTDKLTGHIRCGNEYFGDPMPGKKKQCYCERQMKPVGGKIDQKKESVSYCGSEGDTCSCQGRIFYGKEFDESKPAPVDLDPLPDRTVAMCLVLALAQPSVVPVRGGTEV